jgi:hypothetical protein
MDFLKHLTKKIKLVSISTLLSIVWKESLLRKFIVTDGWIDRCRKY